MGLISRVSSRTYRRNSNKKMIQLSKQEINLKRVLNKCEELVQKNSHLEEKFNWRIKSYINFIENELLSIRNSEDGSSLLFDEDSLRLYQKRVWNVKDRISAADKIEKETRVRAETSNDDVLAKLQLSATNNVIASEVQNNSVTTSHKPKRLQLLEKTPAYQKAIKLQKLKLSENQDKETQQTQEKLSQNLLSKTLQMKSMSVA